jgi:hypothetical protein
MTGPATEPEDLRSLYQRAFRDYGSRALWNMRLSNTPADALAITNLGSTRRQSERLCRPSHWLQAARFGSTSRSIAAWSSESRSKRF